MDEWIEKTEFATGRDVFLVLSNIDHLLSNDRRTPLLSMEELSTAIEPSEVAFLPDFTLLHDTELPAELFTVKEVGKILVKMCKHDGLILEDFEHGIGVRLDYAISPIMEQLLRQVRECIIKVTRISASFPLVRLPLYPDQTLVLQ